MKLSVLSAALLPVLIHAQTLPDCATACISSAIVAASCTPGDNACACDPAKQAEIGTAGGVCLLSSCSAAEIPAVLEAGIASCSSYSATLSGSATATGSIASGTESSESTAAPSTTSDQSTFTGSTSAPSTSAPSTSAESSETTVPSDVSTTDGPAPTTSGGDGGAKAPSSTSTGGAAAMATAFGGVAMALLGVAVAL